MSNMGFFDKNEKSTGYTDPYTTLLGDIVRVSSIVSKALSILAKDTNLLNPKVILPFLAVAKGALDLLHDEVKKAGKFSTEIRELKGKYDHLINDTIAGLKKAHFGGADKFSQRFADGVISQLQWHIKLSDVLAGNNFSNRIRRHAIK